MADTGQHALRCEWRSVCLPAVPREGWWQPHHSKGACKAEGTESVAPAGQEGVPASAMPAVQSRARVQTRNGLNVHSVLQHGKHYLLTGDMFVRIPECDLWAAQEKARKGQQHKLSLSAKATPRMGVVTPQPIAPAPPAPPIRSTSDFARAARIFASS